jgi:hypothetical protein
MRDAQFTLYYPLIMNILPIIRYLGTTVHTIFHAQHVVLH